MSKLLDECEVFENTLYFLALTAEQQAEIRALPSEEAKRARGAELLAETAEVIKRTGARYALLSAGSDSYTTAVAEYPESEQ